jgi:hypothetical protein
MGDLKKLDKLDLLDLRDDITNLTEAYHSLVYLLNFHLPRARRVGVYIINNALAAKGEEAQAKIMDDREDT